MSTVDVSPIGIAVDVAPWQRRDRWRHSSTLTLWIGDDPLPVWVTLLHDSRHDLGPVEWYQSDTRVRLQMPPWIRYTGKRSWVTSLSGYRCPYTDSRIEAESFFYVPLAFDPEVQATPRGLQAIAHGIAYEISWNEDPLAI